MKKTLVAVAALAATGAFAQVTVYGRLDAGYASTTNTALNAAGTTSVDTKASGVQSHNSVSSMWGIRGSEDLGGGMKAMFQLEQDLYTANGNTGASGAGGGVANASGFNRVSKLGLDTGAYGSFFFGRDYNPVFKLISATDINGLSRVSTVQLAAATGTSTVANQIMYSSPVMSGFQLNLALGNDDRTVSTAAGETSVKTTNVSGTYTNGPLMVGLGFGSTEGKAAGAAATSGNLFGTGATTVADKVSGNALVGSYDFGKFKLVGNYITSKVDVAAVSATGSELNLGGLIPMGKVLFKVQLGTNKVTVDGAANAPSYDGSDFVLGADYSLSAKTAVYLTTGVYNKLSGGTAAAGNAVDQKGSSTAFGIKTVF